MMRHLLAGCLLLLGCSDSVAEGPESGSTTAEGASDGTSEPGSTSSVESTSEASSSSADESSTGGGPADAQPWAAGSRLRPVLEHDDEGLERLLRWFDPELEVDCYFAETVDGFACRPLAYWSADTFADASCSEPATVDQGCSEVPAYGSLHAPGCGPPTAMERGEALEVLYRRDAEGACEAWRGASGYRLRPLSPSVALVGATRTLQEVDDQLGRWEYVGDDGSSQWVGPTVLDADAELTCSPIEVDGAVACASYPFASRQPSLHRAADCRTSDVAVGSVVEGCPAPRFVHDDGGGFGTITGSLDAEELWRSGGGLCEPLDPDTWSDTARFYEFRPFESTDAPPMVLERVGSGRLRLQEPRSVDGDPLGLPSYEWFDTQLDTTCSSRNDGSGTSRCAPLASASLQFFGDAACSMPLIVDPRTSTGWVSLWDYSPECASSLVGAARIGDAHEGEVYRLHPTEGCQAATDPGTLYGMAELIPPHGLVVLEQVRR